MKNLIIVVSFVFVLCVISSCNMYKAPCEGVSSIEESSNKI